eukprot:CAMPEP_0172829258 /NCGR_PEP_ID=MMETSP1075-20121228/21410_1 /TAXON_ID=2916 /ORGANISM="Ceratium fusus, Strain PA161109" /LENGTH=139 /DNA_ID=CAMNT_0013671367 /DNA_START=717 /DNA_END=1133 /DNA_ORIENTATION=+
MPKPTPYAFRKPWQAWGNTPTATGLHILWDVSSNSLDSSPHSSQNGFADLILFLILHTAPAVGSAWARSAYVVNVKRGTPMENSTLWKGEHIPMRLTKVAKADKPKVPYKNFLPMSDVMPSLAGRCLATLHRACLFRGP